MVVLSSMLFLCILSVAQGFPRRIQDSPNAWEAPGSSDSRGPCPGLNSAANHGFLDRSGSDLTVDDIKLQLSTIYPVAIEFLDVPIQGAIENGLIVQQEDGSFILPQLEDLNSAKVMEHDASFFRVDSFFGEGSLSVNMDLVNAFLEAGEDDVVITQDEILAFQSARLRDSIERNPEATFSENDIFAMAEQATFLLMMGQQDDLGAVRKDIIRDWVVQNRLHPDFEVSPTFAKVTFDGDTADEVHGRFSRNIEAILEEDECDRGLLACGIAWMRFIFDLMVHMLTWPLRVFLE